MPDWKVAGYGALAGFLVVYVVSFIIAKAVGFSQFLSSHPLRLILSFIPSALLCGLVPGAISSWVSWKYGEEGVVGCVLTASGLVALGYGIAVSAGPGGLLVGFVAEFYTFLAAVAIVVVSILFAYLGRKGYWRG